MSAGLPDGPRPDDVPRPDDGGLATASPTTPAGETAQRPTIPAYGPTASGLYEPTATLPSTEAAASAAARGARILSVDEGSPAWREGLRAGMVVTSVNDVPLDDVITWDWEADGQDVYLEGVADPGGPGEFEFACDMHRDLGEDWGVTFDGAVFDGMRTCRNNCEFCFMKMLPKGMRDTLYIRDDDYRLSFLQGNFVTLTNMTDEDVSRVVTMALSPMNVSLHAVSPAVRRRLIGRNAPRGLEVLEQLLAGGIEVHAQVVLVPHANDGDELRRTLDYVWQRPLITSLGIVPLGFTKHQDTYRSSYADDPALAHEVVTIVGEYQRRSRELTGRTRFQLADEFYLFSHVDPPAAAAYDGYPQYYDGIGMVRSFLDDLADVRTAARHAELRAGVARAVGALAAHGARVTFLVGVASAPLASRAIEGLGMARVAEPLAVRNDYFGGNVDVSGLLTAQDILGQLPRDLARTGVVIPDVILNADGLTLDGTPRDDLVRSIQARGGTAVVGESSPAGMARSLMAVAAQM